MDKNIKKLYAIFVNYNSGIQLFEGVKSVLKSPSVTGIIVVDNGSKDDSLKYLHQIKTSDRVKIIKNKENLGFYKALNIAVKKALELKADAIMPLDFDLDFSFDFITKLLKVDADIVAPVLKFKKDGKWFYDYGGRINWLKGSNYHIITTYIKKNIGPVSSSITHKNFNWYDFVSGGCTIIKIGVFKKIGYFDEDYFVYWGDADFAIQAAKAGFNVVMDGNTIVLHKMEISRQTGNTRKLKISFFDNITFINKRIRFIFKPLAYLNILFLSLRVFLTVIKFTLKSKMRYNVINFER